MRKQSTNLQWTERCQSQTVNFIQQLELLLDLFAGQQIVLRLLHDRTNHIQLGSNVMRSLDLIRLPLASAPVLSLVSATTLPQT